ncbi:MAG: Dps family protein [Bacteroidota bacterium]|jgi:starvation-inducible DNA-binding protein
METSTSKKTNNKSVMTKGHNTKKTKEIAEKLNILLSDYSIFYQNVRGYHWNIKGEKFFELHTRFENIYTDLQNKIDEIAERILALGHSPEHNFSYYKKNSVIAESNTVTNGIKAMEDILKSMELLVSTERDIHKLCNECHDEGTACMMSDYILEQEKTVWMYSAYLNK